MGNGRRSNPQNNINLQTGAGNGNRTRVISLEG
jgi:hypothetical protein